MESTTATQSRLMVHMLHPKLTERSSVHLTGQQADLSGDECHQSRQLDAPLRHRQCDAHALHAGAIPQPLHPPKEVLRQPQAQSGHKVPA